jgi:hypothetical protein
MSKGRSGYKLLGGIDTERDYLEDLDVNWRKILK